MKTGIKLDWFAELLLFFITLSCIAMCGTSVHIQEDVEEIDKQIIQNNTAIDSVVVYKMK